MLIKKYLLSALFLGASLLTLGTAQAALVLPGPNAMSTGPAHDDFYVYPLELIAQCAAAGDPRCLPASGLPVASSTGAWDPLLLIYQQVGGNDNYHLSGPFTNIATDMVDNPFRAPSGIASTFSMNADNEPGHFSNVNNASPEFAGDLIGTWEASLSSVMAYLNGGQLLFLFDNNQEGGIASNFLHIWGQINITDAAGVSHACFELSNSGEFTGCGTDGSNDADFVVAGEFCVDAVTGAAIPGITAKADCAAPNYWLSNNLGSNNAEFAAFSPGLNAGLAGWAAAGYFMSVNLKMNQLTDGNEQLAIYSIQGPQPVPEPGTLWLFALALLAMAGLRRHRS